MLKGTKKPQFDCGELFDPMWMKQQLRILVQQGLGVLYVDKVNILAWHSWVQLE